MTSKTDYNPCPRSYGDGYMAGYEQAVKDSAGVCRSVGDAIQTRIYTDAIEAVSRCETWILALSRENA